MRSAARWPISRPLSERRRLTRDRSRSSSRPMRPGYEIIVQGNNLRLRDGFLGLANVTLIHGAAGPMLVDTGGYVTRGALVAALAARGLAPADISVVFLTHLHFDHAHNIDLFARAKVLVSRAEWDYAKRPDDGDLFMPWGIHAQLEQHDLDLIEGEGEVAHGITYFPAPGHTPGSFAIGLETDRLGTVVIAGDAIKYAKEAINAACDMAFGGAAAGTRSIERILAMADRIVPGHFPELIRTEKGITWTEAAEFPLVIR